MRSIRLMKNTISSLIFQITTIICGFILPYLILRKFGSEVNGLVNSINQFLMIISFLELGVGSVVQSSLYKPLVYRDEEAISKIITSADKFFKSIAKILVVYIVILVIFYPRFVICSFDFFYTSMLIIAIGSSSFAQYYFGVVDRLLLTADQRGYIQYTTQTVTLIANTFVCAVLINFGVSIHAVKIVTSIIYLIRPVILRWYINKHYNINRKVRYDDEPISQKWNGVAQHVAAVVLDATDTVVLTLLSTLENVSIYSVYYLVVSGVKRLLMATTNGIHSLIGELWAKQELKKLANVFEWVEWGIHTGTILIFGCTGVLLLPFIQVYTSGVQDVNYLQPLFAILITMANAGHCLRLPYSIMILAGGHYKQTQHNYIVAVVINIVISVCTVYCWGLIGVAIGTLCAMLYQTIWMARYISQNLIKWPFRRFIRQGCIDLLTILLAGIFTWSMEMKHVEYISWLVLAIKVFLVWLVTVIVINMLFYKEKMSQLYKKYIKI